MTADEAEAPLLHNAARSSQDQQQGARPFELSSESTPLLQRSDDDGLLAYGTDTSRRLSSDSNLSTSGRSSKNRKWWMRWPFVFVLVLVLLVLGVLVFAFVAPVVVRRYAEQAAVFKPTNISVDSATTDRIRARVQGNFVVDATRIKSGPVRNVGRLATWIGREVETSQTEVEAYLPEYGNVLIGTASVPSVTVNVRNGHTNQVDVLADLATGNIPGIRAVAMDWLEGRLGRLRIKGKATLHLKSGIFGLGAQTIFKSVTFEGSYCIAVFDAVHDTNCRAENDFPPLPEIKIHKLIAHDSDNPAQNGTMLVDSSVAALLDVPFAIRIPPLGFEVLVSNCLPGDPFISMSDVGTQEVQIVPNRQTNMNVRGIIQGLSDELTTTCPGQKDSPLDTLVRSYMNGHKTTVYVRGAQKPPVGTPSWVVDLLKSVTVPFHFTGHALDNMIKNFTMSDMHFSLPDPFADPNSPEASPSVSAQVSVTIGLPKQLNLTVDIPRIRANANVFYEGSELGVLELHKWQPANSTRVMQDNGLPALFVKFTMKDVPLRVTNADVLTKVIQALIFQGKSVQLHIVATVDAEVATGLGAIAVRGIPAGGDVNVKCEFLLFCPFFFFSPNSF